MIQTFAEPNIPTPIQQQLKTLLNSAFPGFFDGRIYFKQLPHRRLIVQDSEIVVAQVGLDYRVIRVGDQVFPIAGLIDLCVQADLRGQGLGSKLLKEAELQAREAGVAFMILMADRHDLYEAHNFQRVEPAVTKWLAIEERASVSLIERDLSNCFMAKALKREPWPQGVIDLLGYLF